MWKSLKTVDTIENNQSQTGSFSHFPTLGCIEPISESWWITAQEGGLWQRDKGPAVIKMLCGLGNQLSYDKDILKHSKC